MKKKLTPIQETREEIQTILQNFFAYLHKTNPKGKTELVNYVDWGDAIIVAFIDLGWRHATPTDTPVKEI